MSININDLNELLLVVGRGASQTDPVFSRMLGSNFVQYYIDTWNWVNSGCSYASTGFTQISESTIYVKLSEYLFPAHRTLVGSPPTHTITAMPKVRFVNGLGYTQLPQDLIDALGTPIVLPDNTGAPALKTFHAALNTVNTFYANQVCKQHIVPDLGGTFSCFERTPELEACFLATRYPSYKLDSFYRGDSREPTIVLANATKKQILKGKHLFLYTSKIQVLDQETCEFVTKDFVGLGIFETLRSIMRYRRSRTFLGKLLTDMNSGTVLRITNPTEYAEQHKYAKAFQDKYWNIYEEIYQTDFDESHQWDKIASITQNEEAIQPAQFTYIAQRSKISALKEAHTLEQIEKSHKEAIAKLTQYQEEIKGADQSFTLKEQLIQRLQEKIEHTIEQVAKDRQQLETNRVAVVALENACTPLATAVQQAKSQLESAVEEVFKSSDSSEKWLNNLQKTGVVLIDIQYLYENQLTSLRDDPRIASNPNAQLARIEFVTTKPNIIRVDYGNKGEKCEKVVGGPYHCKLIRNGENDLKLKLKLAASNAVFGHKIAGNDLQMWYHPHTSSFSVTKQDPAALVERIRTLWQDACLGDIVPSLYKGFKNNDLNVLIYGVLAWLGSANSSDTWGQYYIHFPQVSDVFMNGRPIKDATTETAEVDQQLTTETGMQELSEDLAAALGEHDFAPCSPLAADSPTDTLPPNDNNTFRSRTGFLEALAPIIDSEAVHMEPQATYTIDDMDDDEVEEVVQVRRAYIPYNSIVTPQ